MRGNTFFTVCNPWVRSAAGLRKWPSDRFSSVVLTLTVLAASFVYADGLKWDYITQFGGSDADVVTGIARDRAGNIYVTGSTLSYDFPANGFQKRPGGSNLYRIVNGGQQFGRLFSLGPVRVWAMEADLRLPGTLYAWTDHPVDGIGTEQSLLKTADSGEHWARIGAGLPEGQVSSALTVDPTNSNTLYTSLQGGVFKSADAGLNWTRTTGALSVSVLAVDPNHPATVLGGTDTTLYRSEDGGITWSQQPLSSLRIAFDQRRPGVVYAGGKDSVAKSTDSGATWKPLGLYGYYIISISLDLAHPGTIYASGQGIGGLQYILRSTDDGYSWQTIAGPTGVGQLAFDSQLSVLYAAMGDHVVRSSGDFTTWTTVGPPKTSYLQTLTLAPDGTLFTSSVPANDVFVAKLDPSGKLVYATYFGGSGDDTAAGIAATSDGSVFVTGTARSLDFPTTPGAYKTSSSNGGPFVFKLDPDGRLAYSTLLADGVHGNGTGTFPSAIAVDSAGAAYVTGTTFPGIAITPGVIQPDYRGFFGCGILCIWTPDNFVLKLNAMGSDLVYSTYFSPGGVVPGPTSNVGRIAVDSSGNAYVTGGRTLGKLNAAASRLIYQADTAGTIQVTALVLDDAGNLFVAGGAAVSLSQLPPGTRNNEIATGDAFVAELRADGSGFIFNRTLAGQNLDSARGIAVDRRGNATIVGFSSSTDFPTRTPLQGAFQKSTGFVSKLTPDGSGLVYSTFAGDERAFDMKGVVLDDDGNPIFAGNNLGLRPAAFPSAFAPSRESDIFVVRLNTHQPEPPIHLDAVLNRGSLLGKAVAPGEWLVLRGSGFTGDNLQVQVDGTSVLVLYQTPELLVAVAPDDIDSHHAPAFQVISGDRQSNVVLMPSAPYSPAIYTFDLSGRGQGMIFNEDGTPNSTSNPAAVGSVVTIVAEGIGRTGVGTPIRVFIDGFQASVVGFESVVDGLFNIQVRVPDPRLLPLPPDFKLPPVVDVSLEIAGTPGFSCAGLCSQPGVSITVRQQ